MHKQIFNTNSYEVNLEKLRPWMLITEEYVGFLTEKSKRYEF